METMDIDFFLENLIPFGSKRGCALLGKTDFNKLESVKKFLIEQGFTEWNGDEENEEQEHFVVHDCQGKAQRKSIEKAVAKYKDVSYVIFDNCDLILKDHDIIRIFVHLIDKDEYNGSFDVKNSNGGIDIFETSSFYIFIGNENLIPKKGDFQVESAEADRIDSFCTYINCLDFNMQ